jgi:tripartite-type tricarboxylate transporter receptor subunit TctC
MKKRHWVNIVAIVCLLVAGLCYENTNCQAAEKYPSRPIQVVIGFEPGSSDQALRPLIEFMAEYLGQPMNFVYKPGAAGSIGASYVATSKPDGYTLMGATVGSIITAPLTMKGLKYTLDDFVPICRPAVQASGLVVRNDARWKTIKDFVDEAKKNPGKLTFSTSGVLNTNHIPMELFAKAAGFKVTHIPATGSGPAITAVLGGHVDAVFAPMQAIVSNIKAGQLRVLVFSHTQKVADFPNVPLLTDLGYDITYSGYNALVAPKGTPGDVVQILIRASDHAMQVHKKEMEDHFKKLSSEVEYLKGEEFGKVMRIQWDVTKQIVDEIQKSGK